VGNTTVTRFSPFELNVSYSTTTFGGSAYFDGTGDTLSIPSSTPNQFGSGDFTLETWYYCTGSISTANQYLFFRRTTASSIGLIFQINSSKLNLLAGDSNTSAWEVNLSSTTTLVVNNWYHLAMSRSGTTWRIFVNGVLEASATPASFTIAEETANITVGNNIDGFLSNWRAVKGTAVYTSNFTPPVAPVIAISGTAILLNFTNAGVFDNAMMNNYQTVGNASLSTSVVKYGNSSISFDGTGDWLNIVLTTNNLFAFRLGNFTVELWFNGNSVASGNLVDFRPASTNGAYPMIYLSGGQLRYWVNGADRITGGSLSTGTWYHIAVCRSGNSTKMFLDGIQVGSTYTDNNTYLTADVPLIGASAFFRDGSAAINGYVTDFRVSKGVARYTDNFTPPTVPLPQF
jgi:hypothetical protein